MAPIHYELFEAHVKDLKRVSPTAEDVFVCPICFGIFESSSIAQEALSVGHVWPKHIRKGTTQATSQRVLLCKTCNSHAGKAADASMQEFEKIHQEIKTDTHITPPRTRILAKGKPGKQPIRVGMFIKPQGESTITFALESPKTEKRRQINHEITKRIIEYMKEGPISIIVEPPPVDVSLARIGWLTSAYLFAFYTFGYRYIFQSCLDKVRKHIIASFAGKTDASLSFAPEKDLTVARWDEIASPEPSISIAIPADKNGLIYMQVNFRDVHIRMPVSCIYSIVWDGEPTPEDLAHRFFIDGTSHIPHDGICQWEDGFGEPPYGVEGKTMVSRSSGGADSTNHTG
jgi:hypothetical protein